MEIPIPDSIVVKTSPIHGLGVFAKRDIKIGEIIEICYAIFFRTDLGSNNDILLKYRFSYPSENSPRFAIPLGYGCVYNHSDSNNAIWKIDTDRGLFIFYSINDIKEGEEICTKYGESAYWENMKKVL